MGEIFFILKSFFLTFLVVIFMQVKVGEQTIEQKTLNYIANSSLIGPLQEVVDGGVKVLRDSWQRVFGHINSRFFNAIKEQNTPGKRDLDLALRRSKEYLHEQAQKIKERSQPAIENVRSTWESGHDSEDFVDNIKENEPSSE